MRSIAWCPRYSQDVTCLAKYLYNGLSPLVPFTLIYIPFLIQFLRNGPYYVPGAMLISMVDTVMNKNRFLLQGNSFGSSLATNFIKVCFLILMHISYVQC